MQFKYLIKSGPFFFVNESLSYLFVNQLIDFESTTSHEHYDEFGNCIRLTGILTAFGKLSVWILVLVFFFFTILKITDNSIDFPKAISIHTIQNPKKKKNAAVELFKLRFTGGND